MYYYFNFSNKFYIMSIKHIRRILCRICVHYNIIISSGAVAQWLELQTGTKRTRIRILYCGVKLSASVFTLHSTLFHFAQFMNEYLAIYSGGYLCANSIYALPASLLDTSQGSRSGVRLNTSATRSKV